MTLRAAAAAASSGGRPAAAPDIIPGRARATNGAGALELALAALRTGIATGRYALGRRLVEAELITDLNVGRSTVREALRRLAGEGLVEIVRHRGAIVRRLTRRDVANLMLIRQALEATSARLAAERIDRADNRPRLIAAIEHLRQVADPVDADAYAQGDHDFHWLIAQIGANSQLETMLIRIWNALTAVQFWHALPGPIYAVSMNGHEAVVKAILAGNGPAAARAMRRHLRGAAAVIGTLQDDRFAVPDSATASAADG
jgi:DNA-binding GntR family transcriptional regulator